MDDDIDVPIASENSFIVSNFDDMLKYLRHGAGCGPDWFQTSPLVDVDIVRLRVYRPDLSTSKWARKPQLTTLCNNSIVASIYKTYKVAPETAKIAFRTGTYIALFGICVLIAPKTALRFLGFQLRYLVDKSLH
jgi:hypothetical protein